MSTGRQIRLLLWKNWTLRKRQKVQLTHSLEHKSIHHPGLESPKPQESLYLERSVYITWYKPHKFGSECRIQAMRLWHHTKPKYETRRLDVLKKESFWHASKCSVCLINHLESCYMLLFVYSMRVTLCKTVCSVKWYISENGPIVFNYNFFFRFIGLYWILYPYIFRLPWDHLMLI